MLKLCITEIVLINDKNSCHLLNDEITNQELITQHCFEKNYWKRITCFISSVVGDEYTHVSSCHCAISLTHRSSNYHSVSSGHAVDRIGC